MSIRNRLHLFAAVSSAVLIVAVPVSAQTQQLATPSDPWAQTASDVPADPAVRFGTLPNGMRYAVMHNATPPNRASLRLRIDAGSLMEGDDQLGLAHFMEHMAFNGTTNIPENDLLAVLERLGLAFGADTNAATGFDQTFYVLELPRTNEETVHTALHVLREQVSEALMLPTAIDEERGVIAGEERLRNTPSFRASKQQLSLLAPGQRISQRMPIGDLEIIRTAPRERFVEFYNSYYRPSRATMIAVGDFDVDDMERRIRDAFADWEPKGGDGPEPYLGRPQPRGPEAHVVVEAGLQNTLSLSWIRPPELASDTITQRRSNVIEALGLAILNRRFAEMSRIDNPPFINAQASRGDLVDSLNISGITAQFLPGSWKRALEAIDQEQRRLVQYGATAEELQREITTMRTALENAVAGAATRQTPNLANALLNTVNENDVFASPTTDLELFNAAVVEIGVTEINAALAPVFSGSGPLAIVTSPEPIEGGELAVAEALHASVLTPVSAPIPEQIKPWTYTDFGPVGVEIKRRELAELGVTEITFANGAVLLVKPTDFDDESIQIQVTTGRGEQAFSPDEFSPLSSMLGTMRLGGLGRLTADEASRSLAGHIYGVGLSTGEDRFVLGGGTRPEDFALQMQFLTAYLTDAAWRSTPFDQSKAQYPVLLQLSRATPGGVVGLEINPILAGGDKRKGVVPLETVQTWVLDDERRAELNALLADGPLKITIVGDISVDEAVRATASTLGALPRRPERSRPAANAERRVFPDPTPEPLHFTHDGPAEQALGMMAWPTTGVGVDRTEARRIGLMTEVLKLRVVEEVRERLSLAYSPGVNSTASQVYETYGYVYASAQTAPEKLAAYFSAMERIVREFRDAPVTEDELNRAREPMLAAMRRSEATNGWWMLQLAYLNEHPASQSQILDGITDLEAVTPADIQALARQYLRPETAWMATVTSQHAPPTL